MIQSAVLINCEMRIDERLQLVLNEQNNSDSGEEDADGTHAF